MRKPAVITFVAIAAFYLILLSQRLREGIPLAVDTTSHLYKIMLLYETYLQSNQLTTWNPNWYGGSPFLLLYPPLGYVVTFGLALSGIGPVTAYKIVDAAFFLLAPLSVYFLSKDLGLNSNESLAASFVFSLTPEVLENYIFYDRFPNIIVIPIFSIFLITFKKLVDRKWHLSLAVVPSLLLTAILLTHHLSALIAIVVAILMTLVCCRSTNSLPSSFLTFFLVVVEAILLSSFWFLPFLEASRRITNNPFYNRNVEFAFVKFSHFTYDIVVLLLGLFPFILGLVGLYLALRRTDARPAVLVLALQACLIVAGMVIFEYGFTNAISPVLRAGQTLTVLGFVGSLTFLALLRRKVKPSEIGLIFCVLWLVMFLWLGLGYYALPFLSLEPFRSLWRTLDVYRFWLYLALPLSMLAGISLARLCAGMNRRNLSTLFLAAVVIGGILVVGYLKVDDSLRRETLADILPYTTGNVEIPSQVIAYFKSESEYGRILTVRMPLWVYVLPFYVDKPLLDGWYPQEKLLEKLLKINDYRLNDLESSSSDFERYQIWRSLISDAKMLNVKWVMVGGLNASFQNKLTEGTDFSRELFLQYQKSNVTIYKSASPLSLVELSPKGQIGLKWVRLSPSYILVALDNVSEESKLSVKEAYFQFWSATVDGQATSVNIDDQGFMVLPVKPGAKKIELKYNDNLTSFLPLSLATLVALLVLLLHSSGTFKSLRKKSS